MALSSIQLWFVVTSNVFILETIMCHQPMECKTGWLNYSNACYLFNYVPGEAKRAKRACRQYFSALLVIENESERQWIAEQLMNNTEMGPAWFDATSPGYQDYTVPIADEPDTVGGKEKCVILNQLGYFRTEVCSKTTRAICKTKKAHPNDTCPDYLLHAENSRHCFFTTYSENNWTKQHEHCKKRGGDLLSISNTDELNLILKAFKWPSNWWTGLVYNDQTRGYEFSDKTPYSEDVVPWLTKDVVKDSGGCSALSSKATVTKYRCTYIGYPICKYLPGRRVQGCPVDWHWGGSSCYYFSAQYKTSWTQADSECKSVGSHLLKTDSPDEKDWLERTGALNYDKYWTGLNARRKKGVYEWEDGTKLSKHLIKWESAVYVPGRCGIYQPHTSGYFYVSRCWKSLSILACEYKVKSMSCADGWRFDGRNKCYLFSDGFEVTWYSNIDECKKIANALNVHANYITIENKDELKFIHEILKSLEIKSPLWLGLNTLVDINKWVWEGAPGVPGNTVQERYRRDIVEPEIQYRCTFIRSHGTYSTQNCSSTNSFLCEKEIEKEIEDSTNEGRREEYTCLKSMLSVVFVYVALIPY